MTEITASKSISTRDPSVKSAVRVLRILEYFDVIKRGATVMEIARNLDFPQSSTSSLLKSLVSLGYLSFDPQEKTFLPTPRVRILGSWVEDRLFHDNRIFNFLNELSEATGETIILAMQTGDVVRYIHVIEATVSMRLHVQVGTVRSMALSGTGRIMLAQYDDEEARKFVARLNAERADGEPPIDWPSLRQELATIRRDGYAIVTKGVTPGAAIVSVLLPKEVSGAPMAVGIGGLRDGIVRNADHYIKLMQDGVVQLLNE